MKALSYNQNTSFRFNDLIIPVPDGFHHSLNDEGPNINWIYIVPKEYDLSKNHIDASPYSFGISKEPVSSLPANCTVDQRERVHQTFANFGMLDLGMLLFQAVSDHCWLAVNADFLPGREWNKMKGLLFSREKVFQFHMYINYDQSEEAKRELLKQTDSREFTTRELNQLLVAFASWAERLTLFRDTVSSSVSEIKKEQHLQLEKHIAKAGFESDASQAKSFGYSAPASGDFSSLADMMTNTVMHSVKDALSKATKDAETPNDQSNSRSKEISSKRAPSPENIRPYLRRAFMFLEDGDFERADEYLETVLDLEPENAEAYLGKLMVELRVGTREMLQDQQESFDNNPNYQKAMRFGDESLKTELSGYTDYIIHRNDTSRKEAVFQKAVSASLEGTIGGYRIAKQLFASIPGYRNADEQKKRCQELAKEAERKETYERCSKILSGGVNESFDSWTKAINGFEKLGNYRDSPKLAEKCMKRRTQYLLDRLEKANTSDEFNTLQGQIMRLRSSDVPDMDELISRCDKEKTYYTVIESKKGKLHLSSQRRIQLLQKIPGWRDADALLKEELAAAERDRKRKEREKRITEQRAAYKAKYPLKDQRNSLQKEKERLQIEKKKIGFILPGGWAMITFGSIAAFLGLLSVILCLLESGEAPGLCYFLLIIGVIMILIGLCIHPEGAVYKRWELSRKIREINRKIREIDSYPAFDENADYTDKG